MFDITPPLDEKENALLWRAFLVTGHQDGKIVLRRSDGTEVLSRYMAATNIIPGVHVAVMAKI